MLKGRRKKTNSSSCQTPKDNKSVANEIVTTLIIFELLKLSSEELNCSSARPV